jgi:hypothetical protein
MLAEVGLRLLTVPDEADAVPFVDDIAGEILPCRIYIANTFGPDQGAPFLG